MQEVILDAVLDSVKLVPFLLLTYLAMEWLEHRTGDITKKLVEGSGHFGPLIGAVLGVFPQCGFSAAGSSLYAGRIITLGTLFSIYLSTSDEMLPIMLSERVPLALVGQILFCKILIGTCAGFLIDTLGRRHGRKVEAPHIEELCDHDHCHCEKGIWRSALYHTAQVTVFIFLITAALNGILEFAGEDALRTLFLHDGILGELTAGLIGLIPNCAASVMVTQLYLEGVLGFGALLSGLLTGSGIGLLVLFKTNHSWKENVMITGLLYVIGTACGIMAGCAGL